MNAQDEGRTLEELANVPEEEMTAEEYHRWLYSRRNMGPAIDEIEKPKRKYTIPPMCRFYMEHCHD